MKWLFYLLALANSALLALQYWYLPEPEPSPQTVVHPTDPAAPRLVLVSELEQTPAARDASSPAR